MPGGLAALSRVRDGNPHGRKRHGRFRCASDTARPEGDAQTCPTGNRIYAVTSGASESLVLRPPAGSFTRMPCRTSTLMSSKAVSDAALVIAAHLALVGRSEESRVGKEGVRTCSSG